MITEEDIKVGNILQYDIGGVFGKIHDYNVYIVVKVSGKKPLAGKGIRATLMHIRNFNTILEIGDSPFIYDFIQLGHWKLLRSSKQEEISDPEFEKMFI